MDLDEWKKESEFKDKTCESLLLQFKEPKVCGLTIPNAYYVYSLVAISGRILNGEKINPEDINCATSRHNFNFLKEEYFSQLSPRVSEGLMKILNSRKEEYSPLEQYMSSLSNILYYEFHFGEGTWFKIRDSKKEKLEKEVLEYFNKEELDDFNKIGTLFQPYIDRVGAPCPVN